MEISNLSQRERIEENKIWDGEVVPKERNWESSKIKCVLFVLFRSFLENTNICIHWNIISLPLFIIKDRGAMKVKQGDRGHLVKACLLLVLCDTHKSFEGNRASSLINHACFCKRFLALCPSSSVWGNYILISFNLRLSL